jgi:hypothetical protein
MESQFKLKINADISEIRRAISELEKAAGRTVTVEDRQHKRRIRQAKELKTQNAILGRGYEENLPDILKAQKAQTHISKELKKQSDAAKIITKEQTKQLPVVQKLSKALFSGRGGGGAAGGGGGGGGGLFGGLGAIGKIGGPILGLLAGAGAGMAMGGLSRGYETFLSTQKSFGKSIGLGLGNLRNRAVESGEGANLGYNIQERADLQDVAARVTGSNATRALMTGTRATGMNESDVVELMKTMRLSGYKFGEQEGGETGTGEKAIAKLHAAAIASTLPKALAPEFMKGVDQLAQKQVKYMAGDVNLEGIGNLAALFNKAGFTGAKGERATNLLDNFDEMIRNPGGGEEGKSLMRMLSTGYGLPGSTKSYMQSEYEMGEGLFGGKKGTDATDKFRQVMKNLYTIAPGADFEQKGVRSLMLRQQGGFTMQQGDLLQKIYESGDTSAETEKQLLKVIEDSQGTLEQKARQAMVDSGTHLGKMAEKFDRSFMLGEDAAPMFEYMTDVQEDILDGILKLVGARGGPNEELVQRRLEHYKQQEAVALRTGDTETLDRLEIKRRKLVTDNPGNLNQEQLRAIQKDNEISRSTRGYLGSLQGPRTEFTPEEITQATTKAKRYQSVESELTKLQTTMEDLTAAVGSFSGNMSSVSTEPNMSMDPNLVYHAVGVGLNAGVNMGSIPYRNKNPWTKNQPGRQ